MNHQVLRFNDMENIEYRKGSKKFGKLLIRLMEYLRLYKSDDKLIEFNIQDFQKESNIKISDIEEMMNDDEGKYLYKFNINIDKINNKITFSNLTSDKNRFFENNN